MTELDLLLISIRDGDTSPSTLTHARSLLAVDERLPPDLREVGLEDEEPAFAASALLGVLGLDDGLFGAMLGDALRSEAGSVVDELPPELRAAAPQPSVANFDFEEPSLLGFGWPPVDASSLVDDDVTDVTVDMLVEQDAAFNDVPLASAVRVLAGDVDVSVAVLRQLDVQMLDVSDAVRSESGELDLSIDLATSLGAVALPLGPAVHDEAGSVELAASVVQPLGEAVLPVRGAVVSEAGDVDVVTAVLRDMGLGVIAIRQAVALEAGSVDVAHAVVTQLSVSSELPIAQAVRHEGGEADVAAFVAKTLQSDAIEVAGAVQAEAGDIDIAASVMQTLGVADLQVAAAVRGEAGKVDIVAELAPAFEQGWLAGLLDSELTGAAHRMAAGQLMRNRAASADMTTFAEQGRLLRQDVADEAGETPYMWALVAAEIGIEGAETVPGYDGQLVAQAVREQAGEANVLATVMERIERVERSNLGPDVPEVPDAANNRWWQWGGIALAAVALIVVVVGQFAPGNVGPTTPIDAAQSTDFAAADEITVNDLSYGEETYVQVIRSQDDDGEEALIIWIDEEA